jgi:hypothetical protein
MQREAIQLGINTTIVEGTGSFPKRFIPLVEVRCCTEVLVLAVDIVLIPPAFVCLELGCGATGAAGGGCGGAGGKWFL